MRFGSDANDEKMVILLPNQVNDSRVSFSAWQRSLYGNPLREVFSETADPVYANRMAWDRCTDRWMDGAEVLLRGLTFTIYSFEISETGWEILQTTT